MCTNVSIRRKSNDDPVISARTMDFAKNLSTSVVFVPRGQSFPEADLPGEIYWQNKYGFIGMVHPKYAVGLVGYSDGLNEAGLSAAALWLEISVYPKPKENAPILYNINFVSYVLGNFKNVDEVKAALSKITIVGISEVKNSVKAPFHYIVSDASGKHLIVEFINGEMKTYTNEIGVLTNDPSFDWHLQNLYNYENLSLVNKAKICWGDELYGSGQLGSPGDPTAPSRFVRAELLSRSAFRPIDNQQSIGLAQQILQTLTIPCGTVMFSNSQTEFDWTQWGVIRDHTNRSIYFYTAFNTKLYGIHLKKLNFIFPMQKSIEIIQPDWYEDITKDFKLTEMY